MAFTVGKGDKRRPKLVSQKQIDKNWARTFKKPKNKESQNEGKRDARSDKDSSSNRS